MPRRAARRPAGLLPVCLGWLAPTLAGLLLAGLLAACAGPGRPGPPAAAPIPSERLEGLLARTSEARRLRFVTPVEAFAVPASGVPPILERELDRVMSREEFRREEALLRAIGLMQGPAGLRSSLVQFQAGALAGFYAPSRDRLYVVGGPDARIRDEDAGILVHELAHALQAQHTELLLTGLGVTSDQDLLFALGSLLEGDALWTEQRDAQRVLGLQPPSPKAFAVDFEASERELSQSGVPRWVWESLLEQYPHGYALAVALVERGGTPALDAALRDPPLTSEEVLHPERYLEPARRRPLRDLRSDPARFAPHRDCRSNAEGSFGEIGLRVWARERGLTRGEAAAVADGWDGDRAWHLACPGESEAVAWVIHFDRDAEAEEFAEAFGAHRLPSLTLERRGARLLLSRGLEAEGRRFLLEELRGRRVRGLKAWLAAHPEVTRRARSIRGDGLDP